MRDIDSLFAARRGVASSCPNVAPKLGGANYAGIRCHKDAGHEGLCKVSVDGVHSFSWNAEVIDRIRRKTVSDEHSDDLDESLREADRALAEGRTRSLSDLREELAAGETTVEDGLYAIATALDGVAEALNVIAEGVTGPWPSVFSEALADALAARGIGMLSDV